MNYLKQLTLLSIIGGITALLFVPLGLQSIEAVNIPTPPDTVGGLSLVVTFKFKEGTEVVKSFKVFNQLAGYEVIQSYNRVRDTPSFQLIGGVGDDKPMLYHVTDMTYDTNNVLPEYNEFDVTIYIDKGTKVLREFDYVGCKITDYKITTLYDGDETFSGKTQFVLGDVYEFECRGYDLQSPSYQTQPKNNLHYN
jgi:hypothetical protein